MTLVQGSLLAPVRDPVDLVLANLPYLRPAQIAANPRLAAEPRLALDGGPDGLALVRSLLRRAGAALVPGGTLLAEIGSMQGADAAAYAAALFGEHRVTVLCDAFGQDRVLRVVND